MSKRLITTRRSVMKRTLALVLAIAAGGIVATAGSAGPTARSGALHVTKECSQYDGQAGSFCTITSSNIPQIKAGMRVVYLQAFGENGLDSDLVLSRGHGSAAFGHVVLNDTTSRVTFSGGTGAFTGFQAEVDVSADAAGLWHWDGTYSFSPSEGRGD
jgi:hypothetical protein